MYIIPRIINIVGIENGRISGKSNIHVKSHAFSFFERFEEYINMYLKKSTVETLGTYSWSSRPSKDTNNVRKWFWGRLLVPNCVFGSIYPYSSGVYSQFAAEVYNHIYLSGI